MANIRKELRSIRNMQVVSSNRVPSSHACEANKCRIFFCLSDKRFPMLNIKKLKRINLRVRFLPLKIAFFGGFENNYNFSSKLYTATKSRISPQ